MFEKYITETVEFDPEKAIINEAENDFYDSESNEDGRGEDK